MKEYVKIALAAFCEGEIRKHRLFAHRDLPFSIDLRECRNALDMKVKVLSWFSEGASSHSAEINDTYRLYMLDAINLYLDTNFSEDDMDCIYNCFHHELRGDDVVRFIASEYDMSFLRQEGPDQGDRLSRVLRNLPAGSLWTLTDLDVLTKHMLNNGVLAPAVMINDFLDIVGVNSTAQVIKVSYSEDGFLYEWFAHTEDGGVFGSFTDADIGVTVFIERTKGDKQCAV